jgi:hypothetical protein
MSERSTSESSPQLVRRTDRRRPAQHRPVSREPPSTPAAIASGSSLPPRANSLMPCKSHKSRPPNSHRACSHSTNRTTMALKTRLYCSGVPLTRTDVLRDQHPDHGQAAAIHNLLSSKETMFSRPRASPQSLRLAVLLAKAEDRLACGERMVFDFPESGRNTPNTSLAASVPASSATSPARIERSKGAKQRRRPPAPVTGSPDG